VLCLVVYSCFPSSYVASEIRRTTAELSNAPVCKQLHCKRVLVKKDTDKVRRLERCAAHVVVRAVRIKWYQSLRYKLPVTQTVTHWQQLLHKID
jgi:hypothetical protein